MQVCMLCIIYDILMPGTTEEFTSGTSKDLFDVSHVLVVV